MTEPAVEWWLHQEGDLTIAANALRQRLRGAGWSAPEVARPVTVLMELGRNILKYAKVGRVKLWELPERGIVLEAADRGPGIADPSAALRDHFSTGGTLGLGLPGVRRLSDAFDLETAPGAGTRIRVTLWAR